MNASLIQAKVVPKSLTFSGLLALCLMFTGSPLLWAESGHDEHEEGHEEGLIVLTDKQLATANITVEQAAPATIRESLPLYGVITINSEKVQTLTARFPGVIKTLYRKVGDPVKAGEAMALIESNESLKPYTLTSSQSGIVLERPVNPGEQAGDRTLFVVADLSTVWVEVSVFPRDMSKVRIGQLVTVTHPQSGVSGDGRLVYLSPAANSANQTLTARVVLDNADGQWFTGLSVNAEIILSETPVAIAVRNEALQTLENHTIVFVRGQNGFEPRPVRLGKKDSLQAEIIDGLSVGETYASGNSFILKSDLGKEGAEHGH